MKKLKPITIILVLIINTLLLVKCGNELTYDTFRGDNNNSGVYENSWVSNPSVKWKTNLNGTVFSTPAISGSIAYVGSGDNHLYAINITDGNIKWKFKTEGEVNSSPAVHGEMAFFGSTDGYLYAISIKNGQEIWKFKTEGEKRYSAVNIFGYDTKGIDFEDPWDFYLSSPIVENGIVYFGSGDSHIYALNSKNGELIWKHKTGNVVHSSPAINNGIVYCGSYDSKLYALDAKTGNEIWSFQAGTDEKYHLMCGIQASPSVVDGTVYFGCRDAYVYAVDATNGELKWKQKFGGSWMPSSTAIDENKVYVGSSDAKKYFSLNAQTGEIIDSINTNSYTFSSPVITGNTVIIGVFNGYLHAFDKDSGKSKWIFKTEIDNSLRNKYLDSEGKIKREIYEGLAFKDYNDAYIMLDRFYSLGAILSSPVVDNSVIYFTSADGYLYAIN